MEIFESALRNGENSPETWILGGFSRLNLKHLTLYGKGNMDEAEKIILEVANTDVGDLDPTRQLRKKTSGIRCIWPPYRTRRILGSSHQQQRNILRESNVKQRRVYCLDHSGLGFSALRHFILHAHSRFCGSTDWKGQSEYGGVVQYRVDGSSQSHEIWDGVLATRSTQGYIFAVSQGARYDTPSRR
jgi:hypothetical protein